MHLFFIFKKIKSKNKKGVGFVEKGKSRVPLINCPSKIQIFAQAETTETKGYGSGRL